MSERIAQWWNPQSDTFWRASIGKGGGRNPWVGVLSKLDKHGNVLKTQTTNAFPTKADTTSDLLRLAFALGFDVGFSVGYKHSEET